MERYILLADRDFYLENAYSSEEVDDIYKIETKMKDFKDDKEFDRLYDELKLKRLKENNPVFNIKELQKAVHDNAIEHGWYQDNETRHFGDLISLCHTELSEAYEEYRNGKGFNETYYSTKGKPEGIPSELADVVIRIMDMCEYYNIDLEKIILEKHEYNKTRPYKHGGKTV